MLGIDNVLNHEFCDPECNSAEREKRLEPVWLNEKREKRARRSGVNPLEESSACEEVWRAEVWSWLFG